MGWWMVLGTVWWVLFWGLVVWAFLKVTVAGQASEGAGHRPASSIETARRRYAAGEITKDQFDQIRRDLGKAERDCPLRFPELSARQERRPLLSLRHDSGELLGGCLFVVGRCLASG